jgi:hypothetical protein
MRYIYFWIPTINPIKDFIPLKNSTQDNISDTEQELNVKLSVDSHSNLTISFTDPKKASKSIHLNFVEENQSGMMTFSFDENNDVLTDHAFEKQIYHLFKELYHKHDYHPVEEDSILSAYISNEKNTAAATTHYCQIYEDKFKAYAEEIGEKIDRITLKINKTKFLSQIIQDLFHINEKIIKALGELIYYQHLITYYPNEDDFQDNITRIRHDFSTKKQIIEFNIERFQYITAQQQTNISFFLAITSIIIGIYSLYLTTIQNPKPTINSNSNVLKNKQILPAKKELLQSDSISKNRVILHVK